MATGFTKERATTSFGRGNRRELKSPTRDCNDRTEETTHQMESSLEGDSNLFFNNEMNEQRRTGHSAARRSEFHECIREETKENVVTTQTSGYLCIKFLILSSWKGNKQKGRKEKVHHSDPQKHLHRRRIETARTQEERNRSLTPGE